MTTVSEYADRFLKGLLLDPSVPQFIKNGIIQRMASHSQRENDLITAIQTVNNTSLSNAVRLNALSVVIDFFKGDR